LGGGGKGEQRELKAQEGHGGTNKQTDRQVETKKSRHTVPLLHFFLVFPSASFAGSQERRSAFYFVVAVERKISFLSCQSVSLATTKCIARKKEACPGNEKKGDRRYEFQKESPQRVCD